MSTKIGIMHVPYGGHTWDIDIYYPGPSDHLFGQAGLSISAQAELSIMPPYAIGVYIKIVARDSLGYVIYQTYGVKGPFTIMNIHTYNWDCQTGNLVPGDQSYNAYIYSKVLTYDSDMEAIPVTTEIPPNSPASIHIVGMNNGQLDEYLYLTFTVKRPDGSTAQSYSNQSGIVHPGSTYSFNASQFTLNMVGLWTISMSLSYWNGTAWIPVDSWEGNLCPVQQGEPEPKFSDLTVTYT